MTRVSISLGQMNVKHGQVAANLRIAEGLIAEAARRQSQLVVLPELWSSGYDLENAASHADELGQGMFAELSRLAARYGIAVVGSILERRGRDVTNSAACYAADGRLLGVYRKIHLFRLFDEHKWLGEGHAPTVLDLPWGATALTICYDLRFPELYRHYATERGAKMMIVCAEWPLMRLAHWRALLIARAIENQCFVVAVNACGETGGTVFAGHSMILDPWGKVAAEAGEGEQLLTVGIDLDEVERVRRTIPVFEDRRPDMYASRDFARREEPS